MSLYNAIMGFNPLASHVLADLGLTQDDVPRFRDAYITEDGKLAILTRTGGANREDYAAENEKLRQVPGYIRDHDDEFDTTFAHWYFEPQHPIIPEVLEQLMEIQGGAYDPLGRFRQMVEDMKSGADTPEARRGFEVASPKVIVIEDPDRRKP